MTGRFHTMTSMVVAALVLASGLARAATFVVNSTSDAVDASPGNNVCATAGGLCTLRAAIQESNALAGSDTITLPAGTYTLSLVGSNEELAASGDLDVTSTIVLNGAGQATTAIDGNASDRVLDVRPAGVVTVTGVTLRNGSETNKGGGAIRLEGSLTMQDCTVDASTAGSKTGGGILSDVATSSLSLTRVTVTGNTASNGAGMFFKDISTCTIVDSTISGNTATGEGGGLFVEQATVSLTRVLVSGNGAGSKGGGLRTKGGSCTTTLTNVTISGNTANDGGGLLNGGDQTTLTHVTLAFNTATGNGGGIDHGSGTTTVKSTIVSNNTGDNCNGTLTSAGYNVENTNTCSFSQPGDAPNTNPLLGALQDNGGPTWTRALTAGSPAIDTATNTGCPATDQRGVARPIDGNGDFTATCDKGAFEAGASGPTVSGTVFEDPNYGGGAGRSLAASSGVGRTGARVELFDSGGNFLTFTTSAAGGAYAFTGVPAGSYTVRVVNSTVTSSRPGAVGGLLPVQTFRTDASSGTAMADVDRVGGEDPTKEDAGNGSTTLAALTTGTTTAQSVAPVTVAAANVTGVDFGFNFDTIVSTRDAGQGSLRQFLLNSNALGNAGLAQAGLTAGVEHSLFMIPGGSAVPGLRAGLTNQLTAGRALISLATALPTITDASTAVDGTTQTARVGDTNPVLLGTGGTVGIDALPLGQVAGPEVEVRDGAALAVGLRIQGNSARVRGLALLGFGAASDEAAVRVEGGATGALIEDNVLGSTALVFADPGAALRNYEGVDADGATGGTIRDNLLVFGVRRGIFLQNGSTGWTVAGNEIRDSGLGDADGDGIALDQSTATITGSLIAGSSSQGFVVTDATGNTFTNNTVSGNGVGTTSTVSQSAGIAMRSTASTTLIDRNVVRANYGAGFAANNGSTATRLTRNSFADNGTIVARNSAPATGQIGIDLNSPSDDSNFGTAPFYTLNDAGDADAGGNGLLNFPILVSATLSGGNLSLLGFARPGSVIELFVAAPDPTGFGEGETHKITLTEGGTGAGGDDPYADTDATSGSYGPGPINGIAQGTDTTNRFAFTFPVPAGVTAGTKLTATATLGGATSEFGGNVTVGVPLAIVKRGFEADGTPIPSGTVLPRGTPVKFLLYVNNPGAAALDASLRDVLDPTFDYVAGSLRFDGTTPACAAVTCTPAEEAAIFAAADGGTPGTDAVDGDVVGFVTGTVEAGNQYVGNAQLDVPAGKVWALVFTVRMQ